MTAIPKVVHQLWKTDQIPPRWQEAVRTVRRYHRGWEYRLWTDEKMEAYIRSNHPDLHPTFASFDLNIMRADLFRYVLMHDLGGMYCDLDYEFVRPFDYGDAELVLSLEYDTAYGDEEDQLANYVFASVPRHRLWRDILEDIRLNPPVAAAIPDVCVVTGPKLVTRIFQSNRDGYSGVRVTPQPALSPRRVHGRRERKFYINSGVTYGFHHGWGSWRDRWNLAWLKRRVGKWLRLVPDDEQVRTDDVAPQRR